MKFSELASLIMSNKITDITLNNGNIILQLVNGDIVRIHTPSGASIVRLVSTTLLVDLGASTVKTGDPI